MKNRDESIEDLYAKAQMSYQDGQQTIPFDSLQLAYLVTDSSWGKELPETLKEKFNRDIINSKGKIKTEDLWGLYSMYRRDLRLGNLDSKNGELEVCEAWLNLSADLLRDGYVVSFLAAMSRVITIIEISQSKKGFLRNRLSPQIRETTIKSENEQQKKGITG